MTALSYTFHSSYDNFKNDSYRAECADWLCSPAAIDAARAAGFVGRDELRADVGIRDRTDWTAGNLDRRARAQERADRQGRTRGRGGKPKREPQPASWLDTLDDELAEAYRNIAIYDEHGDMTIDVQPPPGDAAYSVRGRIEAEVWRSGGGRDFEIGGFLTGFRAETAGGTVYVRSALAAHRDNTRTTCALDSTAARDILNGRGHDHLDLVGDWHTHPTASSRFSRMDAEGSVKMAVVHGRDLWVSVVATAGEEGVGWQYPTLHGWVARRDGSKWVCERARLVE